MNATSVPGCGREAYDGSQACAREIGAVMDGISQFVNEWSISIAELDRHRLARMCEAPEVLRFRYPLTVPRGESKPTATANGDAHT